MKNLIKRNHVKVITTIKDNKVIVKTPKDNDYDVWELLYLTQEQNKSLIY
tara:strand:- start:1073 stop:1222 length:150 start_codon:yes stop_codon:yes gene_type:complete